MFSSMFNETTQTRSRLSEDLLKGKRKYSKDSETERFDKIS